MLERLIEALKLESQQQKIIKVESGSKKKLLMPEEIFFFTLARKKWRKKMECIFAKGFNALQVVAQKPLAPEMNASRALTILWTILLN